MFPKYTVATNIVSPESGLFIGTCWEFFKDEGEASRCYQRHKAQGSAPTIRPFHKDDIPYMAIGHQLELKGQTNG